MNLEIIHNKIFEVRGQKVMLDFDLAALYDVETKRLNEQVKRNIEKFPDDFMFRLPVMNGNLSGRKMRPVQRIGTGRKMRPVHQGKTSHNL